jgi:cyanate permease
MSTDWSPNVELAEEARAVAPVVVHESQEPRGADAAPLQLGLEPLQQLDTLVGQSSLALCMGYSSGVYGAMYNLICASIFDTQELGRTQGLSNAIGVATTALGPLLFGAVRDSTGSYGPAIIGTAVGVACCSSSTGAGEASTAPARV